MQTSFMDKPVKPPAEVPAYQRPPTKPRSGGRTVLAAILVLLVVAGIVWWTRQNPAQQQAGGGGGRRGGGGAPMSIVPETVGKGDIGVNLNALGTVTSLATVTIRTQISGYLTKVVFKEGDEVKKGDLLAEIDPRPYEAALAQQRGQLARDEATLKGAQVDLARYQGLAAQNAVPHQQLDTQIALVATDQGAVEADRAMVKAAEVNLAYTKIVSPLDGRVGLRQVDQGNYVTPGDTNGIVVVTQLQPMSVIFTLPEDNVLAVTKPMHAGQSLQAVAMDRGNTQKLATGALTNIDNQIDTATGTFKLRAQFDNADESLFPNQFVNVQLLVDTKRDQMVVPTSAIQRGAPGTFVYLVGPDSTVSVRPVKLGVAQGERQAIVSGLAIGDTVVTDGVDRLRDGAKVILPGAQPPAPGEGGGAGGRRHHRGQNGEGGQGQGQGSGQGQGGEQGKGGDGKATDGGNKDS